MAINVPPDTPLPHPVLDRIAYGAPAVPETWNDIIEQIEENFETLRPGKVIIVDKPDDLPNHPTDTPDDKPVLGITYETGELYFFKHDGDAATEADGVNIVGSYGGKTWVRISQPQSLFVDEATSDVTASDADSAVLGLSVDVTSDGVTRVTVTLAMGYSTLTATQPLVEILEDGVAIGSRRLPLASDDNGFAEFSVTHTPAAGTHTYSARINANEIGKSIESKAATLPEHKRTLTVRVG